MIKALPGFPDDVLAFEASGQVSASDYETVLMPAVEAALEKHDRLRMLYSFAAGFSGFDMGAMWDDARVGFSHFNRWERIAVVTDLEWLKLSVQGMGFLMPAAVRVFGRDHFEQAKRWVTEA